MCHRAPHPARRAGGPGAQGTHPSSPASLRTTPTPCPCIPPTRPKEPALVPEPKKPLKRLAARFFQVSVPLAAREPPPWEAGSVPGMLVSPRNSVMFFLRRPGACGRDSQCPRVSAQHCAPRPAGWGQRKGAAPFHSRADLEHPQDTQTPRQHPGQRVSPAALPARTDLPTCIPGRGAAGAAWPSPAGRRQMAAAARGLGAPVGRSTGQATHPATLPAPTVQPEPGRQWLGSSETKGGGASTENLISLLTR